MRFILFFFHDFIVLLQRLVLCRLVMIFCFCYLLAVFYMCVIDSDMQSIFDQTKITNQIMVFSMLNNLSFMNYYQIYWF